MSHEVNTVAGRAPARRGMAGTPASGEPRAGKRRLTRPRVLVGALVLFLFSIPLFVVTDSTMVLLANVAMYTALGSNWNLISGYTGYIDFGHAVFFGFGGYVTAILMAAHDLPFVWTLPVAVLIGGVFALTIGLPLLRVRGIYFSIAMLGAFLGAREIAQLLPITGGGQGLTMPPWTAEYGRVYFYWGFLALAVLSVSLVAFLRRCQLGSSLLAVREDEEGAAARGVNTTAVKLAAFVTAAAMTSLVGAVWAYQNTFVDPAILFREPLLLYLALVVIAGGLGTVWGPVLGAVVVVFIRDVLAANFVDMHLLILGLFLLAVVMVLPEGLIGVARTPAGSLLGRYLRRVRAQFSGWTSPPGAGGGDDRGR